MPPWASSNRPGFWRSAPVKAPFSWPNSSLSSSGSGSAAQLTATSGPRPRSASASWRAWATSSLPVPVSPVIRTVQAEAATRATRAKTSRIRGLWPSRL